MISANNITKKFDSTVALENVTCTINNGCIYGMVGSNGAGKSTFLRVLSGVYKPDGGEALLDGEPKTPYPRQRSLTCPTSFILSPEQAFCEWGICTGPSTLPLTGICFKAL